MTPSNLINQAKRKLRSLWFLRHWLVRRGTYAADREDIATELLLGTVQKFVDVGANDGITCSNSFRFVLRGALGLCFEPDPQSFDRLTSLLRFARRVRCVPEGLSDVDDSVRMRSDGLLSVIESTDDPGLADLLDSHRAKRAQEVTIRLSRLSEWLERAPEFQSSDLLSIDVEGHELRVLNGINWALTPKPARCVVIETHAKGKAKVWLHRDYHAISALLNMRGYRRLCASTNNTFWLHRGDCNADRIAQCRQTLTGYTWESAS